MQVFFLKKEIKNITNKKSITYKKKKLSKKPKKLDPTCNRWGFFMVCSTGYIALQWCTLRFLLAIFDLLLQGCLGGVSIVSLLKRGV